MKSDEKPRNSKYLVKKTPNVFADILNLDRRKFSGRVKFRGYGEFHLLIRTGKFCCIFLATRVRQHNNRKL